MNVMNTLLAGVGRNALADLAPTCRAGIRTVGGDKGQFPDSAY